MVEFPVVPAFTADRARALGGPSLAGRAAYGGGRALRCRPWPTAEEEIWRYSRIDDLDLASFAPAPAGQGLQTAVEGGEGLLVEPGRTELVGSVMTAAADVFAELNTAFMGEPIVLSVPAGKAIAAPVVITHELSGQGHASFPRLVIDAGPDSEVTVVERFTSEERRPRVGRAGAGAASPVRGPRPVPGRERAGPAGLADRQPGRGGRTGLHHAPRRGGARGRLRPGAHGQRAGRPRRQRPPDRGVLRGGGPDARLPHHPDPHRAAHDQRPAVQGCRGRSRPAACTRGSSRSATTHEEPARSRPTATSSCPTRRGPRASPTWTSRRTTCAAAMRRRSAPSTRSSASTWRAGVCRPTSPSGSSCWGSSTRCWTSCRLPRSSPACGPR